MNHYKSFFSAARISSLLAIAVIVAGSFFTAAEAQSEKAKGSPLTQVEAKYVCMMNNQRFEKEMIAVEVDGVIYYGCCEGCKTQLRDKAENRTALDPVSGKKVDKAKAVIGADQDGKVYYFENVENLKKYKPGADSSDHKHDGKNHGSHNH